MHLAYPAVLAALLFCVGLCGVLARRNAILVLMSVELMLNAVNLNLVAFDVWLRDTLHSGQALTLFTIAIAAAEIGIGLAIVLAVYRNRGTSDIDRLRDTAETDEAEGNESRGRPRRQRPPRDHHDPRRPRPPPPVPRRPRRARRRPHRPRLRPPAGDPPDPHRRPSSLVLVAVRQGGGRAIDAATQLTPTGSVPIDLALHLDGFAVLVAVLVTVVATCVQLYSTAYLRDDARYPSYAALVSLFTSAMLLVVYSGDLMVLLVGWEIMGICSYFLVGHYWEAPEARAASLKALPGHQARRCPLPDRPVSRSPPTPAASDHQDPRRRRQRRSWARPRSSPCCSSPASRASRRSFPAHLAARRDGRPHPVSARSSTPRRWSPPASTSWPACCPSSRPPARRSSSSP